MSVFLPVFRNSKVWEPEYIFREPVGDERLPFAKIINLLQLSGDNEDLSQSNLFAVTYPREYSI